MVWITNYIAIKLLDLLSYPCPYFNDGLVKPPLNILHEWAIMNALDFHDYFQNIHGKEMIWFMKDATSPSHFRAISYAYNT